MTLCHWFAYHYEGVCSSLLGTNATAHNTLIIVNKNHCKQLYYGTIFNVVFFLYNCEFYIEINIIELGGNFFVSLISFIRLKINSN